MNRIGRVFVIGWLAVVTAFAGEVRVVVLDLQGLQCYGCVQSVKQALQRVPGVQGAAVDLEKKTATVRFDSAQTNPDALTKAVAAAGFSSRLRR